MRGHAQTFLLVAASTVAALMGTDLILPAVPFLPDALGGDAARAQFTLAAYVAGTAVGLLAFGALADRYSTQALLIASLLAFGVTSLACIWAENLDALIVLRGLQGFVAAGPAVFAPGIIKSLYDETAAVRALGTLGSLEAIAPAVAPVVGAWLLAVGGWRLPFGALGVVALGLAGVLMLRGRIPRVAHRPAGGYRHLLADAVFLRYALSQAFVLGGLLTFVFGMPAVFVLSLGGTTADFVVMQVVGIVSFVIVARRADRFVGRFGAERMIWIGSGLSAAGAAGMVLYALAGGTHPLVIAALFVPVNTGLGLRGPPGFFEAVRSARGDDARGSALVVLAILGVAAAGTAIAAPTVEHGLAPVSTIALLLHGAAVLTLALLPTARRQPA